MLMSIIIILLFSRGVIKINHFGIVRLYSTNDCDYKIHARDNSFIISHKYMSTWIQSIVTKINKSNFEGLIIICLTTFRKSDYDKPKAA